MTPSKGNKLEPRGKADARPVDAPTVSVNRLEISHLSRKLSRVTRQEFVPIGLGPIFRPFLPFFPWQLINLKRSSDPDTWLA